MVIFNELRISDDRSCLIIDCAIDKVSVYSDMYIQSIYLEYYRNAHSASMPGEKAYLLYENTGNDKKVRSKKIIFRQAELGLTQFGIEDFDGGLFYVVVSCDGDMPATVSCLPCDMDSTVDIGAIVDWRSFYQNGMQLISSMFGPCSDPCASNDAFEHYILLWNALKLALSTCDWTFVTDLWGRLTNYPADSSGGSAFSVSRICGCRG